MLRCLCFTLFICSSSVAFADYSPPRLFDMIGSSERILVGTITQLTSKTFQLKNVRVLAGDTKVQNIRILRFRNWTCSFRWTPYKNGQRVVVFLDRLPNSHKDRGIASHHLRSAGSEGEMAVDSGDVYVPYILPGYRSKLWNKKKRLSGSRLKTKDFFALIRGYRACFQMKIQRKPYRRVISVKQLCSKVKLQTFAKQSKLHKQLTMRTKALQTSLRK